MDSKRIDTHTHNIYLLNTQALRRLETPNVKVSLSEADLLGGQQEGNIFWL